MSIPAVAVVIPAYNESLTLKRTIDSLMQQTFTEPWHLIIVDNNSTDDTYAIAQDMIDAFPHTMSVIKEPTQGTGAACRAGFDFAIKHGAAIIARTDADTVLDKDWLKNGVAVLEDKRVHMVAGVSTPLRDQHYRRGDRLFVQIGEVPMRALVGLSRGIKRPADFVAFKFAQGNNMFIRAASYVDVGGFLPTSITTEDEDVELSVRIIRNYGFGSIRRSSNVRAFISMRRIRKLGWLGAVAHHTVGAHIQSVRHKSDVR